MKFSIHKIAAFITKKIKSIPGFQKVGVDKDKITTFDFLIAGNSVAFNLVPEMGANGHLLLRVLMFSREQKISLNRHFPGQFVGGKHLLGTIEFSARHTDFAAVAKLIYMAVLRLRQSLVPKTEFPSDTVIALHIKKPHQVEIPHNRDYRNASDPFTIKDVLARDMCIGCGACSVATKGSVRMVFSRNGMYKADMEDVLTLDNTQLNQADAVCPFSDNARNEDDLGPPVREDAVAMHFDRRLGRYAAIISGREADESRLISSSSGGLTSWLLRNLLSRRMIDGVIHVGHAENCTGTLFEYRVSFSIDELDANRKSFYYSTSLASVMQAAKSYTGKRFAFVGVPCFVKAARLLAESDTEIRSALAFYVGIVCGHMKSALFAESCAWQTGVPPGKIKKVDFRLKVPYEQSSRYDFGVSPIPVSAAISSNKMSRRAASGLIGGNWGDTFFQPNACNFCDDIFAETADIVFGDAWLSRYIDDWRGTNVVAIRSFKLAELFQEGIAEKSILCENISLEDIIRSQSGGLRHRRDGLRVRMKDDLNSGLKIPRRRFAPGYEGIPQSRIALIRHRRMMSERSFDTFLAAKESGQIEDFTIPMSHEIALNRYLQTHSYPDSTKQLFYDIALFGWHHQPNLGGVLTFFTLHQVLKAVGMSVVVIPKPGRTNIDSANRDNHEILRRYCTYSKYRPIEKLYELRNYFKYFVLASDQLWAGKWIPFDPEYEFLGCGDESVKRISVATSFGGSGGDSLPFVGGKASVVTHLLRSFNKISVREPNGVDILRQLGIDSTQILDPVFLAPPSVYADLMTHATVSLGPDSYVMSYILDERSDLVNFALNEVVIRSKSQKAWFMTTMNSTTGKNGTTSRWSNFGDIGFIPHSSFADLVSGVAKANFVFTDSFHGACLAVIFQKPFICCPPDSRGQSRFLLFEQLGLADRIQPHGALNSEIVNLPIDWNEVNQNLCRMREHSFIWLGDAFGKDFTKVMPMSLWLRQHG